MTKFTRELINSVEKLYIRMCEVFKENGFMFILRDEIFFHINGMMDE